MHALLEAHLLLLVVHREPVFRPKGDALDLISILLEQRAGPQKLAMIFLVGAEAHDALDTCTVVPTSIEQHDLTHRGQFRDIALEIPLPALLLCRHGKRHDAADAGVERVGDTSLMTPPLPAASRPIEYHADLQPVVLHPLLHLDQLYLEMGEFFNVFEVLRRHVWRGFVGEDPVLLRPCSSAPSHPSRYRKSFNLPSPPDIGRRPFSSVLKDLCRAPRRRPAVHWEFRSRCSLDVGDEMGSKVVAARKWRAAYHICRRRPHP